jgi:hypothetical protein
MIFQGPRSPEIPVKAKLLRIAFVEETWHVHLRSGAMFDLSWQKFCISSQVYNLNQKT